MRILFITPYFPPEVGAPQVRIHELAVRLTGAGNDVAILTTFPNYPSGIVPPAWRGKVSWRGQQDGLKVYRVWSYTAANRGFVRRLASHLSFAICAAIAMLFLPRPDAVVIESPPLFDGFIGLSTSAFRRIPYLFMVSDLWPESAVQLGMLKSKVLIRLSKAIELLFYRRAVIVLALTEGIRKGILDDGIEANKVLLFRNSVDCDFFRPGVAADHVRSELGVRSSDFLALYAGTFGIAQNLSTVLEAAALLGEHPDIRFTLAGDGAESQILRSKAAELRLANVSFVDSVPKSRMPELINAADCILVPLRDLQIFRGALPTKMFEAMACGKPLILGIKGEAEQLVRGASAGYCARPDSPLAIRDAILDLKSDSRRAREMGARGREYVVHNFSRGLRASELSQALQTAVKIFHDRRLREHMEAQSSSSRA